jgi:hypothetical protein
VLVMHLVHADRVVPGPLAVIQAVAERKRALVEGSTDGQEESSYDEMSKADYISELGICCQTS